MGKFSGSTINCRILLFKKSLFYQKNVFKVIIVKFDMIDCGYCGAWYLVLAYLGY